MAFLEKGLGESGFETVSVNLPTRFGTMEQCRDALDRQITGRARTYQVVNYVAHSMGGLITRDYLNHVCQDNVGRCVFIATPHRGSKLAGIAGRFPFYSRIFKTVSPIMPRSGYVPPELPAGVSLGLIAGNRNAHLLGKLFLPSESDGRVEVASVRSPDACEFRVLPYAHKEIHHCQETLDQVRNFLLEGRFFIS